MLSIRRILKEFIDNDLSWIENIESNFDPNFTFNDKEYWVDISNLSKEEKIIVGVYIRETLKTYDLHQHFGFTPSKIDSYYGFVVHCGIDENDFEPQRGKICFMDVTFDDDEHNSNSIYVDGREVLEYTKLINNEEPLDESLGWSDKDSISWDADRNFSSDSNFTEDPNWVTKPERSYWTQGGGGTSSGDEETVTEEEGEDEFDWIRNTKEFPNYDGFPQGVVIVDNHQHIDTLQELLEKINPKDFKGRGDWNNFHQALEDKRDEFESEDMDASEAVISISFFVEKGLRGGLSFGYWGYEVNDDEIEEWLSYDDTYNQEYRLYRSVYDLEKDLKNLTI